MKNKKQNSKRLALQIFCIVIAVIMLLGTLAPFLSAGF